MNNDGIQSIKTDRPKVSVLMSVYNGERYLREAIDSILSQTFKDFEFLIINDGSTDGTDNILRSYHDQRIRVINNNRNIGLTRSLNKGLVLARAEYIARQDADDISFPDRLEKQLLFMQNNPDIAVLGAQARHIDGTGRPLKIFGPQHALSPLAVRYSLMFDAPVSHPTVVFRKKIVWDTFKGYDVNYNVGQDSELWCRVGKEYSIQILPDVLVTMRLHPLSVTRDSGNPRRINHRNLWRKRRPEVMKEITGESDIPSEWGEWWEEIHNSQQFIGGNAAMKLIRGLDNIEARFLTKYPEARDSEEIRKLTAEYKTRIALYLVSYARLASIAAFYQAVKKNWGVALLYAPKYFSLLLFGQSARKVYKFVKHGFISDGSNNSR